MTVTTRHKLLAKNTGKYATREEAMVKANYSPTYARSGNIIHTKGWQEQSEKALPDSKLLKVHREGLEATKLHTSPTEPDREVPDHPTRFKFLDEAYKLKGRLSSLEFGQENTQNSYEEIIAIVRKVYRRNRGDSE